MESNKQLSFYLATLPLTAAIAENSKLKFGNKRITELLSKLSKDIPALIKIARHMEIREGAQRLADDAIQKYLNDNPDFVKFLEKEFPNVRAEHQEPTKIFDNGHIREATSDAPAGAGVHSGEAVQVRHGVQGANPEELQGG